MADLATSLSGIIGVAKHRKMSAKWNLRVSPAWHLQRADGAVSCGVSPARRADDGLLGGGTVVCVRHGAPTVIVKV